MRAWFSLAGFYIIELGSAGLSSPGLSTASLGLAVLGSGWAGLVMVLLGWAPL